MPGAATNSPGVDPTTRRCWIMEKRTTESTWLHSLRQEVRIARRQQETRLQAQLAELRECDQKIAGLFKELEEAVAMRCDRCTTFLAEKGGVI